ncbi:MAG: ABC transporter ATP-binding protein [Caldicoprobacterales bacterium]|jgi:ABC-type cobalamin/Fe3+-siderophores transport system ATPase subunit
MIELINVSSGYNKIEIIKNINIAIEEGSINAIIGKNGCGKTTLLRTASNLLKPLRGEIKIGGKDITGFTNKELAKKISFLPQLRSVPDITVYNLVMHGRYPYLGFSRTPQRQDKEIVEKAIENMNLEKYINKNVKELSGGERQKVYLAMVLAQNTDIIFLDEPTTYLDINHQLEILEIIKKLKQMGKTIVMVLHDLGNALSYSDKICLMEKGEIAIYDTPQTVFKSREIDRVFNILSAQVAAGDEAKRQYVFCLR